MTAPDTLQAGGPPSAATPTGAGAACKAPTSPQPRHDLPHVLADMDEAAIRAHLLALDWRGRLAVAQSRGWCQAELARRLRVSHTAIHLASKRHRVILRNGRQAERRVDRLRCYAHVGMLQIEAAEVEGCAASQVTRHARRHGIRFRGRYEPLDEFLASLNLGGWQ